MKKNTISIIGGAGRAGLPLSLMLASKNCKKNIKKKLFLQIIIIISKNQK